MCPICVPAQNQLDCLLHWISIKIMIKGIIFDMDGVLIDTPKFAWRSHNLLLSKFKKHVSDEEIPEYLGRSLIDQVNQLRKTFNIDINIEEYIKEFEEHAQHYMGNIQKNEALVNLLEKLKKKYVLGVATSSNKDRTSTILKNLGVSEFFNVVITADDVKKHKPDPAIFFEAAKKLNITPNESVVIEDALNGIEAAKSGNMRTIGLVTKYLSVETLSAADLVIESLEELSEKLEDIEGVNLSV